jgi:hypothetical protein
MHHVNAVRKEIVLNTIQPASEDHRLKTAAQGIGKRPSLSEQFEAHFSRPAFIKLAKDE